MKSCPRCDGDTRGSTKFCPECGHSLQERSPRELGTRLEDGTARILEGMGYVTEARIKVRGESGQLNEIDIMAEKGGERMAVECKNYESSKVGIKEMRDFDAKLKDIGVKKGLFVTSSAFSKDAAGWAETAGPEIELWDMEAFTAKLGESITGRHSTERTVRDSLPIKYPIDDYASVRLQNAERVRISSRRLDYNPYYMVKFTLRDQCKTPDRHVHPIYGTGECIVDGLTGRMIYGSGGKKGRLMGGDEDKKIGGDLNEIDPYRTATVVQTEPETVITVHEPGKARRDVEFEVSKYAAAQNTQEIKYTVAGKRGEKDRTDRYRYVPSQRAVEMNSEVVWVPRLEVVFASGEHTYTRVVLPASDTVILDEIARCKHTIGSKPTHAVCNECGVAKCEKDLSNTAPGEYYCKKHVPREGGKKSGFGLFKR